MDANTTNMAARQLLYSGANLNAQIAIKRAALHEWRDECSRTMRAYSAVMGSEGVPHKLVRRRSALPAHRLEIPDDCREILVRWREPVSVEDWGEPPQSFDDPTKPEPGVRRFEREGLGPGEL